MTARTLAALAALALAACASPTPAPKASTPARVAVDVARGGTGAPLPPPRIALVVDATSSMRAPAASGVSRLAAAQTRAVEILETAPPEARLSVDAFGPGDGEACREPISLAAAGAGDRQGAVDAVRELSPGGEASLADALVAVGRGLQGSGVADGARVVALTDLDDRCGGDLCAAVKALVDSGASLDLVVLGERPTPSCVLTAEPTAGGGRPGSPGAVSPAPGFRVLPAGGAPVSGVAGGDPVTVAAGGARIEVALDPPLALGPLPLAPGSLLRVRVLDFPAASPPQREWVLDVVEDGESPGSPPSSRP